MNLDAPTEFEVGLQNQTIVEDEPLILECILTKDREDDQVTWTFNGEPLLIDNDRVKLTKIGPIVKLIIDEGQLTDEGRYQAEINDKTSKANIIVKGNLSPRIASSYEMCLSFFQRRNFNSLDH